MSAAKYDFSIEQGSSFKFTIIYKDDNGAPIDITNYCARLTWRTGTQAIQIFTTENNDLSLYNFYIDGPNGKLILLLPASVTNSLDFTTAKYDLELQSDQDLYSGGGKEITRLLYGVITLVKRNSQINTILAC
jgi:hypothetical protein